MAHELAISAATGLYRMAYRRRNDADRPWHDDSTNCTAWYSDPDLATVLHDLEAFIDIETREIYDRDGFIIEEARETWRPFTDVTGNPMLDKDGKPRGHRLGLVGPSYTILQDREVVEWFRPWVENGLATIETGGAIFGGSRFWVLAKINKDPAEVVSGDPIQQYVLAFNGHDGKISFKAFPTDVRAVCSNTINISLKSDLSKKYRIKHSKVIHSKVEEIREDIEIMHLNFLKTIDTLKVLAGSNVANEDDLKLYFQKVLKEKEDAEKEIREDGKRPLHVLMRLFDEGIGNDMPGVKGTWWAAFNSCTEFCTHLRGRNSDARLDNMISGIGQQLTSRALNFGLAAAKGLLAQAA